MPVHEFGLLSTLVVSLVAAFAGGLLVRSVRLPPLLGYLLAGVCIGPFTPVLVANQGMAKELAEIGVALLLFNIGLHFSFKDLLAVRKIVIPGALIQIALCSVLGGSVAFWVMGTSFSTAIVIALSVSIASTAVATRVLEEKQQMRLLAGRVALGWLVVQDLVVIFALVLLPVMGKMSLSDLPQTLALLGRTLLQVTGFVAVMVFGGRRMIPWVLGYVARSGSRELFTLAVIVIALGIAYGSSLIFGVSLALGAFFAGVVIGESDLNHHAAAEALSMQQVFTILFFVSVGMLFDPVTVLKIPYEIILFLAVIILGMGLVTFLLLLMLRVPIRSAALVGAAFAQIGEFSFVLAELGFQNGSYDASMRDMIVGVAIMSILINPAIMFFATHVIGWVVTSERFMHWQGQRQDATLTETEGLHDHAILVGYGRVGRIVAQALRSHGLSYVVLESDRALAEKLRGQGETVIFGDAAREAVMSAASPEKAKLLVVTVPDPFFSKQIARLARRKYPEVKTVVRTHSDEEARAMTKIGVGLAVMGEREIAFGMTYYALQALGLDVDKTRTTITDLRKEIYSLDQQIA